MTKYDVAIIDDDHFSRSLIDSILKKISLSTKTFDAVKDFLEDSASSSCRCIVSDILMPETSGLELLEILSSNDIKIPIILITGLANIQTARQAFKGGAIDFIPKPISADDLIKAVQDSLGTPLKIGNSCPDSLKDKVNKLTNRERVVLNLLIEGNNNNEIAQNLSISVRTVETHRLRLLKKLDVTSVQKLLSIIKK